MLIHGSGFAAGEQVSLQVTHLGGGAEEGMGHEAWTLAAAETGALDATWSIALADAAGADFVVTATGEASGASASAEFVRTASISTDSPDYRPGDTVGIWGGGFVPLESVLFRVTGTGDARAPWRAAADATGAVATTWIMDSSASSLELTAAGEVSGAEGRRLVGTSVVPWTIGSECMVERFNETKPASATSLNCTSNDVRIAQFTNLSEITSCIEREPVAVELRALVEATSAERWDVGFFVAMDGKDPNLLPPAEGASLQCYNDYLHPVSADNSDLDVAGGSGPFYNGELGVVAQDDSQDQCGDIQQAVDNYLDLAAMSVVCQDNNGDGIADVPACTVWANSATTKTDDTSCQSELDTTAETTAKCTCESVPISNLVVRKHGTIAVDKVVSPSSAPGLFNLQIDGATEAANVGNGGSTGSEIVDAGTVPPGTGATHSVGETAGTGTSLADYNSSIACTSDQGHSASASGAGPLSILVLPDEDWTCTITNTLKPAHLTLVKQVVNDNGGTALATAWTLAATGTTSISGASGSAAVTNAQVMPGSYALGESGGPAGYLAGNWSCVGGSQSGASVTLGPDQSATCTITNDDIPASLTLVKEVVNDNGGTAVAADWTLGASGPTPISGAGGVVSGPTFSAGTYTLSESGPTGYAAGAWSCVGGTQVGDTVAVGLGGSATCTISNNDMPPVLILVKHVTNDNGGTASADDWVLSAVGPTTIFGSGGASSGPTFSAGTYDLSEFGPLGYADAGWSCVGGVQDGDQITVGIGVSATCEITNDDRPPYLKLVKEVINDNGGTAVASDWTVSAAGPTPISGAGVVESGASFEKGTYALSESGGAAGYTAGTWSCVGDGTLVGSDVTLGLGDSAVCTITNDDQPGHVTVLKTVSGAPPSGDQHFVFQIRHGASPVAVGHILETRHASPANGGFIAFATDLDANTTYQLCEIVMPGWLTTLGGFVPAAYLPDGETPNPNVDNSILCVDFSLTNGQTLDFTVDNTPPPGGRALTIGYWKNWASCARNKSPRGQRPVLDQTLAATEPIGVVVSATSGSYPAFGEVYYLVLHGSVATPDSAPDCLAAVRLLNKSKTSDGTKMARDPAFNLAAQLIAAQLNYAADAYTTAQVTSWIQQAVLLLGKYHFDGSSHTAISAADKALMLELAGHLDDYNNDNL